jgi:hypothetical protein
MTKITITIDLPRHMSETELRSRISMLTSQDWLANFWSIDDVKEVADDLTDEQCREVLRRVEHNHDANIGINWEVLEFHADCVNNESTV